MLTSNQPHLFDAILNQSRSLDFDLIDETLIELSMSGMMDDEASPKFKDDIYSVFNQVRSVLKDLKHASKIMSTETQQS